MGDQNVENTAQFLRELKEQAAKAETEETPSNTYTDADGTVFEWDAEKRAWFPKVQIITHVNSSSTAQSTLNIQ